MQNKGNDSIAEETRKILHIYLLCVAISDYQLSLIYQQVENTVTITSTHTQGKSIIIIWHKLKSISLQNWSTS